MLQNESLKERMAKLLRIGVVFYRTIAESLEIYKNFPIAGKIISRRDGVIAITRWRAVSRDNPDAILESRFFPEPAGGLYFDTQTDVVALNKIDDTEKKVLLEQIGMWEQVFKTVYPATYSAAIITF